MRRLALAVLLVLLPLCAAAAPAGASPAKAPRAAGFAADQAGHPLVRAKVVVTDVGNADEHLEHGIIALGSIGLLCIFAACTDPTAHTTTDLHGHWSLTLPTGGDPRDLYSVTVLGHSGSSTTAYLSRAEALRGRFPSVRVWTPAVHVDTSTGMVAVHHSALPAALGRAQTEKDTLLLPGRAADEPRMLDISDGVDPRVVEDLHGKAEVLVGATYGGHSVVYAPAPAPFRGGLRPVTRGLGCTLSDADGVTQRPQSPCRLTDGNLGRFATPYTEDPACASDVCPSGTPGASHRDLTVTLPSPQTLSLILVHGCGFTCSVSVSSDGATFTALDSSTTPEGADPDQITSGTPDAPVVAIRVETAGGGFLTGLHQISAFT